MRKLLIAALIGTLVFSGCTAEKKADNTEGISSALQSEASPKSSIPQGEPNISLSVKNITPTGLTAVITRDGECAETDVLTGLDYRIDVKRDGEWTALPTLRDDICWDSIGIGIPPYNSTKLEADWTNVYAPLVPGEYRFVKSVSVHGIGGYEQKELYAEFTADFPESGVFFPEIPTEAVGQHFVSAGTYSAPLLCYEGRVYAYSAEYSSKDKPVTDISAIMGGKLNDAFSNGHHFFSDNTWLLAAHNSSAEIYEVKGYDPKNRVCVYYRSEENGCLIIFDRLGGVSYEKGRELYGDILHTDKSKRASGEGDYSLEYEPVKKFIDLLYESEFIAPESGEYKEIDRKYGYPLSFTDENGIVTEIKIYTEGYFSASLGGYKFVSKADTDKCREIVYALYGEPAANSMPPYVMAEGRIFRWGTELSHEEKERYITKENHLGRILISVSENRLPPYDLSANFPLVLGGDVYSCDENRIIVCAPCENALKGTNEDVFYFCEYEDIT